MAEKKYVGYETLQAFLTNLRNIFSPLKHEHKLSEISDYVVDKELSATSDNPVANSVINTEFDAITDAMNTLTRRIFIGTHAEYETANANNEIPIGALVILTDDGTSSDGGNDQTSPTTSMLGYAVLGQMVLG